MTPLVGDSITIGRIGLVAAPRDKVQIRIGGIRFWLDKGEVGDLQRVLSHALDELATS